MWGKRFIANILNFLQCTCYSFLFVIWEFYYHDLIQVASFGGFLLKENIITISFAPRDSHKSQIQFALERGIPAFVAMLGTRRLPFSAYSFDLVHCSRCLIPFTAHSEFSCSYLIFKCVDSCLISPFLYIHLMGTLACRWNISYRSGSFT